VVVVGIAATAASRIAAATGIFCRRLSRVTPVPVGIAATSTACIAVAFAGVTRSRTTIPAFLAGIAAYSARIPTLTRCRPRVAATLSVARRHTRVAALSAAGATHADVRCAIPRSGDLWTASRRPISSSLGLGQRTRGETGGGDDHHEPSRSHRVSFHDMHIRSGEQQCCPRLRMFPCVPVGHNCTQIHTLNRPINRRAMQMDAPAIQ
jgi:hypothetical protein